VPFIDRHRPGPKAACRIACAVVHAQVWTIGFDARDPTHATRIGIEPGKAVADGEQEIA
jgi:hypothetical protein